VTSSLRDNEGTVYFRNGRVVGAKIRSNPHPIGQMLLQAGKITEAELEHARAVQEHPGERRRLVEILVSTGALSQREVERQMRRQIEAVVFELLSWQEGFFSFSEGNVRANGDGVLGLSTESLLMEAARRIDEWSRIAHLVPNLSVVPVLADVDRDPPMLDLRPNEWQVLSAIDGATDVRSMATAVGMSEFDVAKIVYGLVSTGIVVLRDEGQATPTAAPTGDTVVLLSDAQEALRDGRPLEALNTAERAVRLAPQMAEARLLVAQALAGLGRFAEAEAHLQSVSPTDPQSPASLMALARLAVRRGDLSRAIECWQRVVLTAPQSPHADSAGQAMAHAARLNALVEVGQ